MSEIEDLEEDFKIFPESKKVRKGFAPMRNKDVQRKVKLTKIQIKLRKEIKDGNN